MVWFKRADHNLLYEFLFVGMYCTDFESVCVCKYLLVKNWEIQNLI